MSDSRTVLPFWILQQASSVFIKLRCRNKWLELIFFFFSPLDPFVYFGFLKYFGTLVVCNGKSVCIPLSLFFAVFTSLGCIDIVTREKLSFGNAEGFSTIIYTCEIQTYKQYSNFQNLCFLTSHELRNRTRIRLISATSVRSIYMLYFNY